MDPTNLFCIKLFVLNKGKIKLIIPWFFPIRFSFLCVVLLMFHQYHHYISQSFQSLCFLNRKQTNYFIVKCVLKQYHSVELLPQQYVGIYLTWHFSRSGHINTTYAKLLCLTFPIYVWSHHDATLALYWTREF